MASAADATGMIQVASVSALVTSVIAGVSAPWNNSPIEVTSSCCRFKNQITLNC
jgi:hypothetical protein